MRDLKIARIVFLSLTFSISLWAQTPTPDSFLAYEAFLAQHKDMTTSDLLAMHPTGEFKKQVGVPWESVSYHEVVDAACKLTPYEKSLAKCQYLRDSEVPQPAGHLPGTSGIP